MTKVITIILLSFTLFPGCGRHPCASDYITPVFVGFSVSDIDTLVVRKYKQNDNFLHLVDTVVISASLYGYIASNDTTVVDVNTISGYTYITADFDWQIYIPAKNRTISVSNIVSMIKESSCYRCTCINPITSFVQDGQLTLSTIDSAKIFGLPIGYITYIHN